MGPLDTTLETMMSDRNVWGMVAIGLGIAVVITIGKALFLWLGWN